MHMDGEMSYFKRYLQNLLLMALVFGGMLVFMRIFYPDALGVLPMIGQIYGAFNLWPIIVLMLLVMALPRRRQ
jgi:hypothetical protein